MTQPNINTDDCWLFAGQLDSSGYGDITVYVGSGKSVKTKAHRVMYENLAGKIPEGLEIDHLCRVPTCINPAHLEPVTGYVNMSRGESPMAKNIRKTHCHKGHPLTGDNLYLMKSYNKLHTDVIWRRCRECEYAGRRRRYHLNKLSDSVKLTLVNFTLQL